MFATLSFFDSVLNVTLHEGARIDGVLAFLSSHFTWREGVSGSSTAVANVNIYPAHHALMGWDDSADWEPTYLHHSATPAHSIPARRSTNGNDEFVETTRTGTRIVFRREYRQIDIALAPVCDLDIIELIRDLVLKDQENHGVLALQAASAQRSASVAVIAGPSGAGKSTVLLELAAHHGFRIVSGQVTLLRLWHGALVAYGWPDFPQLGLHTIDRHTGLRTIAGIPADAPTGPESSFAAASPVTLDPNRFRSRFSVAAPGFSGAPTEILLPSLGTGNSTLVRSIEGSAAARAAAIEASAQSAFVGRYSHWQSYITDSTDDYRLGRESIIRALSMLPIREVRGEGVLDASTFVPVFV